MTNKNKQLEPVVYSTIGVAAMFLILVAVYVIAGVAPDVPMETIFKGIYPFLIALVVCTALLIAFPQIVLYLPSFMTY